MVSPASSSTAPDRLHPVAPRNETRPRSKRNAAAVVPPQSSSVFGANHSALICNTAGSDVFFQKSEKSDTAHPVCLPQRGAVRGAKRGGLAPKSLELNSLSHRAAPRCQDASRSPAQTRANGWRTRTNAAWRPATNTSAAKGRLL